MANLFPRDLNNRIYDIYARKDEAFSIPIQVFESEGTPKDITNFEYKMSLSNEQGEIEFEKTFTKTDPLLGLANLTITKNSGQDDWSEINLYCYDFTIYECNAITGGDADVWMSGKLIVLPGTVNC